MKQLLIKKGVVQLKEVPAPALQPEQVCIALHYSCISPGTEGATIHAAKQSLPEKFIANVASNTEKIISSVAQHGLVSTVDLVQSKLHQHLPLGYSCAGRVVAIGSKVKHIRVGDYVAAASSAHAFHAEQIAVPEGLVVKLVGEEQARGASTVALGAIAMHGLRRAGLQFGETVCIVGLGFIGQLTLQLARVAGLRTIGIDLDPTRIELARSLGCDVLLHGNDDNVTSLVQQATQRYGVDAAIITASASSDPLINQAMSYTKQRGTVVIVGDVPLTFDRALAYSKEIDVRLSCSYGPGRYDARYEQEMIDYPYGFVRWTERRNMAYYVQLLAEKKVHVEPLFDQVYRFDHAPTAYQALQSGKAIGALLAYHPSTEPEQTKKSPYQLACSRQKSDTARVALIGAGGFVRVKLLPLLARMDNVQLHSIVEVDQAVALGLSEQYGFNRVYSDHRDLLDDPQVTTVIVATPHASHAQISIDCLHAGKAVFCEKPAVITYKELESLTTSLSQLPNSCYTVDFNRSLAPLVVHAKQLLASRHTPLSISYRMNAGFIPHTHWQQDEHNRGRIIGEVCHIIELFCNLVDAKPTIVSVASVPLSEQQRSAPDTLSIQLSFYDGSIATLQYIALGNNAMEKERMELFFDGKSIVLDDYHSLVGYGIPVRDNRKLMSQDKGHAQLLEVFMQAACDPALPSPIPFDRLLLASKITLIIDELARAGGGSKRLL